MSEWLNRNTLLGGITSFNRINGPIEAAWFDYTLNGTNIKYIDIFPSAITSADNSDHLLEFSHNAVINCEITNFTGVNIQFGNAIINSNNQNLAWSRGEFSAEFELNTQTYSYEGRNYQFKGGPETMGYIYSEFGSVRPTILPPHTNQAHRRAPFTVAPANTSDWGATNGSFSTQSLIQGEGLKARVIAQYGELFLLEEGEKNFPEGESIFDVEEKFYKYFNKNYSILFR